MDIPHTASDRNRRPACVVFPTCRKLHGDKKLQIEAQLIQWEADGITQRCKSSWATLIYAAKKTDGSWRICGDFRRLNIMTKLDRYPLPALTSFNEQLAGCNIFSKIHLRQAFQKETAIITTIGLIKFLRMPNGLKNAARCFQRNVNQLLNDLPFACFIYMDDISSAAVESDITFETCVVSFNDSRALGSFLTRRNANWLKRHSRFSDTE